MGTLDPRGFRLLRCHILARGCKGGGRAAGAALIAAGGRDKQRLSRFAYKYWRGSHA